jgi:hypothetical protein
VSALADRAAARSALEAPRSRPRATPERRPAPVEAGAARLVQEALGNRGAADWWQRNAAATARRDDPSEREADRLADALLATSPRRLHDDAGPSAAPVGGLGPGRPLPPDLRAAAAARTGWDPGGVRVHADAAAARAATALGARAFALGSHIVVDPAAAGPETAAGRRLLAHELAHVVQQHGGAPELGVTALPTARIQLDEPVTVIIGNPPEPLARYHVLRDALGPDRWERLNAGALRRGAPARERQGASGGRSGPLVEIDVPVRDLLRPRVPEQSTPDWKAAVFRAMATPTPDVTAASAVMQRQLAREWSEWNYDVMRQTVRVAIVDPQGTLGGEPGLTFQVGGRPVPTDDGALWVLPLDAATTRTLPMVSERFEAEARDVSEAAQLAQLTDATIAQGRDFARSGHRELSQDDVTAYAQMLGDLAGRLGAFATQHRGVADLLGEHRERFEAFRRDEARPFIDAHAGFLAGNQPSQSYGEFMMGTTRDLLEAQREGLQGGFLDRMAAGYTGQAAGEIAGAYAIANLFTGGAVETSRQFHEAFRGGHISLAAFEEGVSQARTRGLIWGAINVALMAATWGLAGPVLGTGASLGRQILFFGGASAITSMSAMTATSIYTSQTPLRDPYAQQIWRAGEHTPGQIALGGAISFGLGAAIPIVSWLGRPANAGAAQALVAASAEGRVLPPLGEGLSARTVSPGVVEITQQGSPGALRVTLEGWELRMAAGRGQAPVLAERWVAGRLPPVRPELLEQAPHLADLRGYGGVSLGGRPFGVMVSGEGWAAVAPGTRTPFLSGTFGPTGPGAFGPAVPGAPLTLPGLSAGQGAGPIQLMATPAGRLLPAGPSTGPAGPLIVDLQSGPMVGINPALPGFGQPSLLSRLVAGTPGAQGVGIEAGDFLIGYPTQRAGLFGEAPFAIPGAHPTSPLDLMLGRQIVQATPQWPPYSAGQVGQALGQWPESQLAQAPFALQPWQIEPSIAFPRSGPVVVLTSPGVAGGAPVPQAWFPAIGGPSATGAPRLVPMGQADVAALAPSTHPELHGIVDRLYWRRPFAMTAASDDAVRAMGQEIDRMLKSGGFAEFRVLRGADADVVARLQQEIGVSRAVTIERAAIRHYAQQGTRPAGLSDEQWQILQDAGSDIRGGGPALGEGLFARIIRLYKR